MLFTPGTQISSIPRNVQMDKGKHWRARLGFILMSTDLACESDLFEMAPEGVAINITRLKTEDHTTNETLAHHIQGMADAASRIQPDTPPDVVCYCCTSGSIVIGEERIMGQIRKGAPHSKPMTLVTGVVDALRELDVKKLVIGTPYLDEINTLEAEFFHQNGFDILDFQGLNLADGISFGKIAPDYLCEFALSIDRPDADAIFLSCSGIRSLEVAEKIEQMAGKPVITSNQAMMWSCLRRAGVKDELTGFGQIFSKSGASLTHLLAG